MPELNQVVEKIHADLIQLAKNHRWLTGYSDENLKTDGGMLCISFYPKFPGTDSDTMAQQPDHLSIRYCLFNAKWPKYSNTFEEIETCTFPELGAKIYGEVWVRGDANQDLLKKIRTLVVRRCDELQQTCKKVGPSR